MRCLGCATSFKEGQKLEMEGLHIEYKNYNIPIKQEKVLSFLNSRGGTIYIGVEDSKGQVRGVQLYQKQKLQFQIFLKRLLTNVTPRVSMDGQSLIKLQFVPVVCKNTNQNKYVIKIVVRQGDSSIIYCHVQKVVLQDQNKQIQEHQILYGYLRHNMGGVEQCKGLNLLKQIRIKALKPIDSSQCFHSNCNPDPIVIQDTLSLVCIEGILLNQSKQIQNLFEQYLIMLKVQFTSCYKEEKQTLMIKFSIIQQFQKVKENIRENIQILNVTFEKYQFGSIEEYQRQVILQKVNKGTSRNKKQNKTNDHIKQFNSFKEHSTKKIKKEQGKVKGQHQQKFKDNIFVDKKSKKQLFQPPEKEMNNKNVKKQQYFSKKFCVTITCLDNQKIDELIKYIDRISKIKNKKYCKYVNSLQIFLQNWPQKQFLLMNLLEHLNELKRFSSNQKYFIAGDNTGTISISNYNYHRSNQLLQYIMQICQQDIKCIGFACESPHQQLQIHLNKSKVCFWLDQLLENHSLKRFRIPGSQKGAKPLMKIRLKIDQYMISY